MIGPTIGLDCSLQVRTAAKRQRLEVYRDYTDAVERAGGVPVLLPVVEDPALVDSQLDLIDGLILVGGRDLTPKIYGARRHSKTQTMHPSRQLYDIELARAAIRRNLPVLGICGGLQLVNVVCGGDLIQHLPDAVGDRVPHRGKAGFVIHDIAIVPGTRLARIVGAERLEANSGHHQAAGRIGGGLRVSARSADDVVEALEAKGDTFCVCVQWHPEQLARRSAEHFALFRALVEAAGKTKDVA